MKCFVHDAAKLYGPHFKTYNVHNLIHLPKDVENLGSLEKFSAYPFENHLQIIKNLVRKSALPLEQIVKRVGEIQNNPLASNKGELPQNTHMSVIGEHFNGPILPTTNGKQHQKAIFKHWKLSRDFPNNVVVLKDGSAGLIRNFIEEDNGIFILLQKYKSSNNFFTFPMPSHKIGTIQVSELSELQCYPLSFVQNKAIRLPIDNGEYVVSTLL